MKTLKRMIPGALIFLLGCGFTIQSWGQVTPAATTGPQSVVGTVVDRDSNARTLRIKNDQNQEVRIGLQPGASFRRVAPGESDLKNASTITLADIAPGDRVLARGSDA